jgi:hypothetical protein
MPRWTLIGRFEARPAPSGVDVLADFGLPTTPAPFGQQRNAFFHRPQLDMGLTEHGDQILDLMQQSTLGCNRPRPTTGLEAGRRLPGLPLHSQPWFRTPSPDGPPRQPVTWQWLDLLTLQALGSTSLAELAAVATGTPLQRQPVTASVVSTSTCQPGQPPTAASCSNRLCVRGYVVVCLGPLPDPLAWSLRIMRSQACPTGQAQDGVAAWSSTLGGEEPSKAPATDSKTETGRDPTSATEKHDRKWSIRGCRHLVKIRVQLTSEAEEECDPCDAKNLLGSRT